MKEINRRATGITTYGKFLGMTIGVVKNNADPMHHGRLQVYVPAYDAIDFKVEDLPWASYISPFGGAVANFAVGREHEALPGISGYGFWAIPKNNAQVLIGCIDGNPETRFWVGCLYMPEHNRTLPSGIDGVTSEIDESGLYPQTDFPHMQKQLSAAGLWKGSAHFRTRGGYERSVSHPSNKNKNKPTDNGYAPKPLESGKADSQTVSLTTPGRHMFVMSDVDEQCRIRLKTTSQNQIILDDTNERIYISTGKGKNWVEMDEGNGRIYIYSDSKINIRAKNDLNLYSDENINIRAHKRVMIESETRSLHLTAKYDITAKSTAADIYIMASRDLKLRTFDGPKAPVLPEVLGCKGPPLDKLYRWPEKGGSPTSHIELDAAWQLKTVSGKSTLITVNDKDALGFNLKVNNSGHVKITGTTIHHDVDLLTWKPGLETNLYELEGVDSPSNQRYEHKIIVLPGVTPASAYKGFINLEFPMAGMHLPVVGGHPGLMILPDHESWIRDEDIVWCVNRPRNAKYIDP
jgi:hypothetical protein